MEKKRQYILKKDEKGKNKRQKTKHGQLVD